MMSNFCCFCGLLASEMNCESYLETWDPKWQSVVENLPPGPGDSSSTSYNGVTLNVSFACYNFPGLNGLQYSSGDLVTTINFVKTHGGKARVSFGGASYAPPCAPNYFISQTSGWPSNYAYLASGVLSAVSDYSLDGVDFDIEDPQPSNVSPQQFASDLITFLKQVRAGLPAGKTLSITIPAQGWGTYWFYLATGVAAIPGLVDYINFMEYDIWVGTPTYPQQIEADLTTYMASPTTAPAPNYSQGWGIPAGLIQLGLMPGCDDIGNQQYLSLEDSDGLASTAKSLGLYGVMTWDLNRDAGSMNTPPCPVYPTNYEYIDGIRDVLSIDSVGSPSYVKSLRKRRVLTLNRFERQDPPSHGSP